LDWNPRKDEEGEGMGDGEEGRQKRKINEKEKARIGKEKGKEENV